MRFVEAYFLQVLLFIVSAQDSLVGRHELVYEPKELPSDTFLALSNLGNSPHLRETVQNILVPRVVGTEGHQRVREFIVKSLRELQWAVELHKFNDTAPIMGELEFQNIIARLNPDAERFLVLSCHYDSKFEPDFEFLGATDSAVPCAMLLNLAEVLVRHLEQFRSTKLSLMLIFFDGEEAFENWGPKDSIYGARQLARKWEAEGSIDRIDLLILLDLIGAPDPQFYSYFKNTESWYSRFLTLEERLADAGLMAQYTNSGVSRFYPNRYFQPRARNTFIEDDHLPFLKLDVPVVHLIPVPFPSVWHTENDNESIIDYATTENISRILRLFVMEYLLGIYMDST